MYLHMHHVTQNYFSNIWFKFVLNTVLLWRAATLNFDDNMYILPTYKHRGNGWYNQLEED